MARKRGLEEVNIEATAVQAIEQAFQKTTSVQSIVLNEGHRVHNSMSTGILILDLILGGGIPRGKIVDFWGPEGAGKSTILQHIIAAAQAIVIPVVHYDFEFGVDPTYMRRAGVDLQALIQHNRKKYRAYHYVQPMIGDDVYEHINDSLRRMPDIDQEKPGPPTALFIIDSFAAMTPRGLDPITGEGALGLAASMHTKHLRTISSSLGAKGAVLIATNQIRANLKIGPGGGGGHSEPGGYAIKHYPDVKVKLSRSSSAKIDSAKTKVLRQHIYMRTTKNKSFPPFQEAECDIILGRGIDPAEDVKAFLLAIGKLDISANGQWYDIGITQFKSQKKRSWPEFRELAQNPKFREFCFGLLKKDQCYGAYFQKLGVQNYAYDQNYAAVDQNYVVVDEQA